MHRDYTVGAPVQIRVYEDRLKIWNPAVLPDGWTLEKLLGDHSSTPFNPDIANAFFRAGEIEAWGRGIWRIFQACKEAGTPKPLLRYDSNDMWMEFPFSKEYLKAVQDGGKGLEKAEPGPESRPESRLESRLESRTAARIFLRLAQEPLGKSRLATLLGHKTVSGELHKQIRHLLTLGVIEMTIADKPNSRLQKYRLTAKGKAILAARENAAVFGANKNGKKAKT